MAERIVVTGGTGFLGSYVVPELVGRYASVAALVRPTSDTGQLERLGLELRVGDLSDERGLRSAFSGCQVLVNLASLGFGHAPNIIRAAVAVGIRRTLFISTTAIFTSLPAKTRAVRLEAEAWVRNAGLAYTLLRPTMIYGSERDRNISRLIRYLARYPVMVVPGPGTALQQPVYVQDLAMAVVAALERPESIGKSYNVAGPEPLSFNQLVELTARALGRTVARVHVPLGPAVLVARLASLAPIGPRIRPEQILRLGEDKAFDISTAREDLGFDPVSFDEGVRRQVAEMFGAEEGRASRDMPHGPQMADR